MLQWMIIYIYKLIIYHGTRKFYKRVKNYDMIFGTKDPWQILTRDMV